MKLNKLNEWLTLLANVGVLAGIVFLAIEVKNSRVAITHQMHDSIADGFISLNLATIADPTIGENFNKGLTKPDELSSVEAIRFSMHMRALFVQFRRVHVMYASGLLKESEWALYAREASAIISMPGGKLHSAVNELDAAFRADIERYAGQRNIDFSLGRDPLTVEK